MHALSLRKKVYRQIDENLHDSSSRASFGPVPEEGNVASKATIDVHIAN